MERMEPDSGCKHCGAPREPALAACKYCKTPFVQNVQTQAVPCPHCKTVNVWGATRCAQCQTWVVVQCVFCSHMSPHHVPACLHCGEPFAGAPERLAQRSAEAQRAQTMQVASTVGSVAATFLGAMAGVALSDWDD